MKTTYTNWLWRLRHVRPLYSRFLWTVYSHSVNYRDKQKKTGCKWNIMLRTWFECQKIAGLRCTKTFFFCAERFTLLVAPFSINLWEIFCYVVYNSAEFGCDLEWHMIMYPAMIYVLIIYGVLHVRSEWMEYDIHLPRLSPANGFRKGKQF